MIKPIPALIKPPYIPMKKNTTKLKIKYFPDVLSGKLSLNDFLLISIIKTIVTITKDKILLNRCGLILIAI